ncbi:MAG TPA: hypothetical protein VK909_00600 [Anaerolineales bacterium]|nr:hypothetical protein [Anaerolineales bacterium]
MRAKKRQSFLAILLILGIGIPGFIGIFAVQVKAVADQSGLAQQAATLSPSATFTQPPASIPSSTSTTSPLGGLATLTGPATLYAYIQAPSGPIASPYVILKAFSSVPRDETITIRGIINSSEFVCPSSSCVLYLQTSSRFDFRAYSDRGEVSQEVIASVSVTQTQTGYLVSVDSVNQFTTFRNACANIWGVSDQEGVTWDDFVQSPAELNTKKTLHTLATQLLLNGIVDASSCPSGGLSLGLNWPTACGLEKAESKMLEWQNQYDEYIWLASRDTGFPPKILKTFIEIESQFWPGNSRFFLDEYGLGQINQLGVDVLLRQDPTLYNQVCPGVLADCSHPYVSLAPAEQAMIRGAVVKMFDATCADCENGLDLNKAKQSISLLAQVMVANCQQVDNILGAVVVTDEDVAAATATAVAATIAAGGQDPENRYEDLWRFTLLTYHSGSSCFQRAVVAAEKDNHVVNWDNVSQKLKCKGGEDYVNGFMDTLKAFDFYRYQFTNTDVTIAAPTIVPTITIAPSATPFVSTATVKVQVFMDRNGNKSPDEGEWIDAMSVLLTTSSNDQITQRTENGITVFDMTGYTPGIGINVSLPGLYRSQTFVLPAQGETVVTFMFEQPVLPTSLP